MEALFADPTIVPPAPGGDLRLMVTCRTSTDPDAPTARHPVDIAPDWSVSCPHDLEAEQLAVAFGGYLSCLALVETGVPAVREWVRRAARIDLPHVSFAGEVDRWRVREQAFCCPRSGFTDAQKAAEHWRSPRHVAAVHGAETRQVVDLAARVRHAHAGFGTLAMPEDDRQRAALACLRGGSDVVWLWDAGIHPRLVWRIHQELGTTRPMPARFYLGVAWNRPDLRWVAHTLAGRDEPQEVYASEQAVAQAALGDLVEPLATWLAWSAANWDVIDPTARARWLASGVSRPLILELGKAGYDPSEVVAHARAVGRTPDGAARTIRGWLRAGLRPSPASLTRLVEAGVPAGTVPSGAAVARLRAIVGPQDAIWSDTELALLLVEHGTVAHAAKALIGGALPC